MSAHLFPPSPLRTATVVALPISIGALMAWWMPRGPVTPAGVVASVVLCAALGFAVGRIWGSRWSLPVAPLLFAATYEVARAGVVGPSVDRPRLDTTVAVLVLVVGRGLQALLQLLPIALGAAYGAAAARRGSAGGAVPTGWRRALGYSRSLLTALVVVGLVVVTAA